MRFDTRESRQPDSDGVVETPNRTMVATSNALAESIQGSAIWRRTPDNKLPEPKLYLDMAIGAMDNIGFLRQSIFRDMLMGHPLRAPAMVPRNRRQNRRIGINFARSSQTTNSLSAASDG